MGSWVLCQVCRRGSVMLESMLLRLPHTILFQCPICKLITVVDTTGRRSAIPSDGDSRAT